MKKIILLLPLFFFIHTLIINAAPPVYPIIIESIPNQPSLKATIELTDGTTLKDLLILSNNEETDPGSIPLRFFRPPLKSSLYIKDLKSIEFEKTDTEKGLYEGDFLNLSLRSGKSDRVEYLSGLNDGLTVIYKDDFSGYYQKLYIPLYIKSSEDTDIKKLHVKRILFTE